MGDSPIVQSVLPDSTTIGIVSDPQTAGHVDFVPMQFVHRTNPHEWMKYSNQSRNRGAKGRD